MDSPSSFGPGMTIAAPAIGPLNASDQPLAWNIGTTGMTISREESPMQSGDIAAIECNTFERCE